MSNLMARRPAPGVDSAGHGKGLNMNANKVLKVPMDWYAPYLPGRVGNGCGLEQLRYLKPNDVIVLEAEQTGIVRTRVTKP
jgi:hypothetical protein